LTYKVEISPSAKRQLATLPRKIQKQLSRRIDSLAINPKPSGIKRLQGNKELFRIRAGDYRVIYTVEDQRLTVLVIKIGHRREIYRGM
jgi:mRNA interferase RelE/StbE